MVQVDVVSAYAICGAGGLAGALLMRDALAPDALAREVLRDSRLGFWLLAGCLLQVVVVPDPRPAWSQALIAIGAIGYVVVLAWTLARLSGHPMPRSALALTLACVVAAVQMALPLGTRPLAVLLSWGMAGASLALAWTGRALIRRPRNPHERLFGLLIALMVPVHLLRASYTVTLPGPAPDHLLLAPPHVATVLSLLYGMLPVLVVLLLFNVLNARRQARLYEGMMTDHLTGALTRHALAPGVVRLRELADETGDAVALILVDLDHFKRVNDQHGHGVGDEVLRRFAARLRETLRPEALVVRLGGEEFLAAVPAPGVAAARNIAERLRHVVAVPSDPLPAVTASFGVALVEDGENVEQALARADEALYRAKHGGRNQVQVALAAA